MIHSASAALCPHIVWALEAVLDTRLTVEWSDQPAGQRLLRAEIRWNGPVGTGAQLATALRGWDNVRYEVTEEHTAISQGSRYVYTPSLGIHHSWMAPTGDTRRTSEGPDRKKWSGPSLCAGAARCCCQSGMLPWSPRRAGALAIAAASAVRVLVGSTTSSMTPIS